jgi:hypothetical protein
MTGILRVPRSRGALSGVLLILLGAWGALIPLVGPYFHYGYTPDTAWTFTSGRIWLEIVPGAAAFIGGLIVLTSSLRPVAMFGAWLAALSGAWFAVGTTLSPLWAKGAVSFAGSPTGGTVHRAAEQIGFFTGLGVLIAFLAALVIGRLSVIGVRDARLAESREARSAEAAAEERRIAEDRRIAEEHRAAEDQRAAQDADLSTADPAADGSAASDSAAEDEATATRA